MWLFFGWIACGSPPPPAPATLCCEVIAAWCIQQQPCEATLEEKRAECWPCDRVELFPSGGDTAALERALEDIERMECEAERRDDWRGTYGSCYFPPYED